MTKEEAQSVAERMITDLETMFPVLSTNTPDTPDWWNWEKARDALVVRILESHTAPIMPVYQPSPCYQPYYVPTYPWYPGTWWSTQMGGTGG